ncbi:Highly reducing polyketide synthase [Lachnellula subtilissima]|uniref:Highly reducing polyketide synthase n=1 Tax=Lachnellula subtilissima TaxID=602034 RepID=A0A8H8RLN6_9HELO|nr:Highly reducing polyketide synthase [Lachnellula subtilissima]
MQAKLDTSIWTGINERLRKILYFSIVQQQEGTARLAQSTQIITGIPVPQPADSGLIQDARFAPLFTNAGNAKGGGDAKSSASKDVQAVLLLLRSRPQMQIRNWQQRSISSISAFGGRGEELVEGRVGALVTTLDIVNVTSLLELCKKIVAKVVSS